MLACNIAFALQDTTFRLSVANNKRYSLAKNTMNCITPLSSDYPFNQLLLRGKIIRTDFLFQIPNSDSFFYEKIGFISVT